MSRKLQDSHYEVYNLEYYERTRKPTTLSPRKYKAELNKWMKEKGKVKGFTKAHGYLYRKVKVGKGYELHPFGPEGENGFLANKRAGDVSAWKRRKDVEHQTPEGRDLYDWDAQLKGVEGHHIRVLKMYRPFFEGLDDNETKILANWFLKKGYPLGDDKGNIIPLTKEQHRTGDEAIHRWLIRNRIQVDTADPGFSNLIRDKDGKIIGAIGVGDEDSMPHASLQSKMPNLSHIRIDQRLPLIESYLDIVQEGANEKLREITGDQSIGSPVDTNIIAQDTAESALVTRGQKLPSALKAIPVVNNADILFNASRDGMPLTEATREIIPQINPASGTANALQWEHLRSAQNARARGSRLGLPELGVSEYLGIPDTGLTQNFKAQLNEWMELDDKIVSRYNNWKVRRSEPKAIEEDIYKGL